MVDEANKNGANITKKEFKETREEFASYFQHYFENDRTSVMFDNVEYLDYIPSKAKEYIMTEFLYHDVLNKPTFRHFFQAGQEFNDKFLLELSFGFQPRMYEGTEADRFILEEFDDVPEITFIMKGTTGVAFKTQASKEDLDSMEDDEKII